MTSFAQEAEMRENENKLLFIKRLRKTDPERAKLYCDHGNYIGSNGLFRPDCKGCNV